MSFVDALSPPLLTADLPGIGGRIKTEPEDFDVEEVAAYQPSGSGEFLYLWIEKRDMGAEYFARQVAKRLDIPVQEVGMAGLKDRHAVTRQWVSVPGRAESRLPHLEGDGLCLLQVSRHGNKLRPGHLHGNRFRILLRDVVANASAHLRALVDRLRQLGFPNYYGSQRFGKDAATLDLGLRLLRGEKKHLKPFLRKLALSAAQSALFNQYLAARLRDGLLHRVLRGDVMARYPAGGMFVAEDVELEQQRFDAREIVPAGPIFGRKTFAAAAEAAEREQAVLAAAGLTAASFAGFGKLLQGTRRHNLVFPTDLSAAMQPPHARLAFTLPAGAYATVLLRELTKTDVRSDEEPD